MFADDMTLYVENLDSTKKNLRTNKWIKQSK